MSMVEERLLMTVVLFISDSSFKCVVDQVVSQCLNASWDFLDPHVMTSYTQLGLNQSRLY